MVSSTGCTIDHSKLLREHRTPTNTPITTDRTTESPMRLSVSIAAFHISITPQNTIAKTQNSARRSPPNLSAGNAIPNITTTHGIPNRKFSQDLSDTLNAPATARVTPRKYWRIQSSIAFTHSANVNWAATSAGKVCRPASGLSLDMMSSTTRPRTIVPQ